VHTPKVGQTKFGECTTECVHVGFAEDKKAYLLYNRECQQLFESHNVEFEEVDTREHITVDLDSDADGSITPGAKTGDQRRDRDQWITKRPQRPVETTIEMSPATPQSHWHPHHPFQPSYHP